MCSWTTTMALCDVSVALCSRGCRRIWANCCCHDTIYGRNSKCDHPRGLRPDRRQDQEVYNKIGQWNKSVHISKTMCATMLIIKLRALNASFARWYQILRGPMEARARAGFRLGVLTWKGIKSLIRPSPSKRRLRCIGSFGNLESERGHVSTSMD